MTRSIIRPDERGEPDDIVLDDVTCFRMERMDAGLWWIAAYRGDKRLSLFLRGRGRVAASVAEDDFGCVNDAEPEPKGIGDDEGDV